MKYLHWSVQGLIVIAASVIAATSIIIALHYAPANHSSPVKRTCDVTSAFPPDSSTQVVLYCDR